MEQMRKILLKIEINFKKKENQEGTNLSKKKRKGKFKKKSLQNSGGESQFKTAV